MYFVIEQNKKMHCKYSYLDFKLFILNKILVLIFVIVFIF